VAISGFFRALEFVRVRLFYNEFTIATRFRQQGAHIGERTRLLICSLGSEPWLVRIDDEVLISGEVLLSTHDGGTWVGRDLSPHINKFGRITIGRRAMIATRAVILPGVTIGERAVIGSGSVVTRDVPASTVFAGVPARFVCTTDEYLEKAEKVSLPLEGASRAEVRRVTSAML